MGLQYDFVSRSVIVTGSGSGIGQAVAVAFARSGARVVVADIDADGADRTVQLCRDAGADAVSVRADAGQADDIRAAVAAAVDNFGALDHSVNCAGIHIETSRLHESDEVVFDTITRTNLKSMYLSMKYEITQYLAQGRGGTIVNIASVNSFRPQPLQSIYTASKHGVIGLTKAAAVEYSGDGIRINAIAPGAIDTPLLQSAFANRSADVTEQAIATFSLLGRFGVPDEVADAALWLTSDSSAYVVGHALAVDAGYLAR